MSPTCNNCGQEIKWKYTYAQYQNYKKKNPDFKNIPLNLDGTPHRCLQPEIPPEDVEAFMPEKVPGGATIMTSMIDHKDRRTALMVAKDMMVARGIKGTDTEFLPRLIRAAQTLERYLKHGR